MKSFLKNKKVIYLAVILISIAAVLISANYLKPKKQLTEKRTEPKQTNQTKNPKPEKPSKVLTYKQEVITVADAGESEKDVGIAKGGGEGELSSGPSNISVDKYENIYISDIYNGLIKKYEKTGKFIKNISPSIYPWQTLIDNENNIFVYSGNSTVYKINQSGKVLVKYKISIPETRQIFLVKNFIYASLYVWPDTDSKISLPEGSYIFKIGTVEKTFNAKQQRKSLIKGGRLAEDGNFYSFEFVGKNQSGIEIKDGNQKIINKFKIKMKFGPGAGGPLHFLNITKDKIFISANPIGGHMIQSYSKDGQLLSQARPFNDYKKTSSGPYWETQFVEAVSEREIIYVIDATLEAKKDAFKILKLTLK